MKRPYVFSLQIPRREHVNLKEIEPTFIAEAESMEDSAKLLGGKLLWKETLRNAWDENDILATVGVISVPRERFNTLPTYEDYEKGYTETGDLMHGTLQGFRLAISPEEERFVIGIVELPFVTFSQ